MDDWNTFMFEAWKIVVKFSSVVASSKMFMYFGWDLQVQWRSDEMESLSMGE